MVGKVGLETPGVMGAVPLPGTQEGRGHEHDDQQQSHSQSCGDTDEQLWQVRLLALLGALEKKCEGGCGWTPPPNSRISPAERTLTSTTSPSCSSCISESWSFRIILATESHSDPRDTGMPQALCSPSCPPQGEPHSHTQLIKGQGCPIREDKIGIKVGTAPGPGMGEG